LKLDLLSEFEPAIEWFRRQGHRIIFTPSTCWYDAFHRVYQAFPYNWIIEPSTEELRYVMREGHAVGLRYSTPLTASIGKISYHVVYSDKNYTLDKVTRQARQSIRKGIEFSSIEPISLCRLAEEGWILHCDTLHRQGRLKLANQAEWRKFCLSAEDLPGFEAWGAIREGKLVASLLIFLANGSATMLCHQSRTAYLKFGINNALVFVCTQNMLARPEIKEIFYGLNSLDASYTVDEFKFRMGYKAKPVRQRVVFRSKLKFALNPLTLAALESICNRLPYRPKLAKVAGMMKFFLDGKPPLTEQSWPWCLQKQREEFLLKKQSSS